MKRIIAGVILLAVVLVVITLAACGSDTHVTIPGSSPPPTAVGPVGPGETPLPGMPNP